MMTLTNVVSNSRGSFLVRTVMASANIEFGNGYETMVHPMIDGEPDIYKAIDYKHSESRSQALRVHQEILDRHGKF